MRTFLEHSFSEIDIGISAYVYPRRENPLHKDRPFHGFVFNLEGIKEYTFESGSVLTLSENEILYLPKHSTYTVRSNKLGGCFAINFDCKNPFPFKEFLFSPKHPENYLKCFQKSALEWEKKQIGYYERSSERFYRLISMMKQEFSSKYFPDSKKTLISPAIDYIAENYAKETITIPHMAELCGISEPYLRKIFKNTYGVSPLQYIRKLRLNRAKELIDLGEFSIHEAAETAGFSDDSYFSREFKKEFGKSPSNYAKKQYITG